MRWLIVVALTMPLLVAAPSPARAVGTCGPISDTCSCGGNNPYPCCDNGGNCTWYAWHAACCYWGKALPGWGNANTWAGYANSHPDYVVKNNPTANCLGNRVTPQYPGDQWGHITWVVAVGNSVKVEHMGCWSFYGVQTGWYDLGFFDKYICLKGGVGPDPIGPSCGDGSCNGGETCQSCPQDCGQCCGNGQCDNGETCETCEGDCGPCCGNGACDYGETCQTCETDCGPCCPNGECDYGETCQTCEADCGPCCGNGTCDSFIPEHCFNCPVDCGQCCGNGSCDWGENCEACAADCGECVYMPQGYLEVADCAVVSGWSTDPDSGLPVTLEMLVDGEVVGKPIADEPTEEHGDSGFSMAWPEEFKDGEAHLVEIRAFDDTGLAGLLPGSGRWVLCGSAAEQRGIWTVQHAEAGGIDIDLSPTFEPGSALSLVHPGSLAWPVCGSVEARTMLGADPLDEVRFQTDGGFDPALYSVELLAGATSEPLAQDTEHWIPLEQPGEIGIRLSALDMATDPSHRLLELSGLEARTGPWWNHYSWDAAGFTWEHGAPDRVAFELRNDAAVTRGTAATWHLFEEPFDGVSFAVDQDLVEGLAAQLLVDGALLVQMGPSFLQPELDIQVHGYELRYRYVSEPDLNVPEGAGIRIEDIRVHRSRVQELYPWQLTWTRAWDLDAVLPDSTPIHRGLAIRLSGGDGNGWFSSGDVEARTQVSEEPCEDCSGDRQDPSEPDHDVPAFDRVRGLISYQLPEAFTGHLKINDELVREVTGGDGSAEAFDIEKDGWFFAAGLAVGGGTPGVGDAWMEVTGLAFHRGGWWTTADNGTRGLIDGRLDDCGVTFKSQPGWGEAGLEAVGQIMVQRTFLSPVAGVRFRREGAASGLNLSLVIDGQDADALIWMDPVGASDEEWSGEATEVGFRVALPMPWVYGSSWALSLTEIEVKVGGAWRAACDHPESDSWEPACVGDDCDPGVTPDGPGVTGESSGGCGVGDGPAHIGWLLLFLLLVVAVSRPLRPSAASRSWQHRVPSGLRPPPL